MVVKHRSSRSCDSGANAGKGGKKKGSGSGTFRNSEVRPTLFFSLRPRALNAACSRGSASEAVTQHPELPPHHSLNSFSLHRSRITLSATGRKWKNMRRQAGHTHVVFQCLQHSGVWTDCVTAGFRCVTRGMLLIFPRKKRIPGKLQTSDTFCTVFSVFTDCLSFENPTSTPPSVCGCNYD